MNNEISLKECFDLQLSEVEMLTSMYPNREEFVISLPYILTDMKRYVCGDSNFMPNQLDLLLNLNIPDLKYTLEMNAILPHKYPFIKPEIFIRCAVLDRSRQRELNSALEDFLQTIPDGDLCVLTVINWITENAGQFFSHTDQSEAPNRSADRSDSLSRMWIYSHHIYNKCKRREIVDTAEDLGLSGFSLPGKPGIVCVEGHKRDCGEFLLHLKSMSWKKLSLIREETKQHGDINKFRRFTGFSEISFQVRRGPAREYHMDMGQFLKYLGEHDCAYVFQDIFGLEGQVSSEK